MPNNLPSINLAKDRQISSFDKFLNWTFTIGRLIVIITEVVAVIAFVYRFSLDEKIVDLHTQIKQKQSLVSALKNDESKYRNLQDRITLAANFSTKATKSNQIITDIVNLIPNQVKITNLILNKDRINLDVEVTSVSSLENFVSSLQTNQNIKSVNIDNIENKPSLGLYANIVAMLK